MAAKPRLYQPQPSDQMDHCQPDIVHPQMSVRLAHISVTYGCPSKAIFHPFLTRLASLSRQELARQVTYLKTENRILRSKLPDRITLSNQERRMLVKHGKALGARLKELVSIVSYSTFRKWVRSIEDAPHKRPKPKDAKPGRPRVEESISDAISSTA